ncbi:MAG: ABC transporter ATP-binding protein [Patescibacteria group bacterium]
MNTSAVTVKGLVKRFGKILLFKDFSVEIEPRKITAIFGPNGSGKSTLLNIIAGITTPDKGERTIDKDKEFRLSYIFQNYRDSLFPWRTNFENIAFPLEIQGLSKEEIRKRVEELQTVFEFQFDWNAYPYQLSGGQQQILAFIRALVTRPTLLLIDEPFSALDYENNLLLRKHLLRYYESYRPTVLIITHNIEEAVHLSHRILVLGKNPTTILDTIENGIPFPRSIDALKSETFHRIKDKVLQTFQRSTSI